ncbi:MAG: FmdB family zinc ribbon protein [Acidimicrobiales bacterium]
MPTYDYRCSRCGEQFELWQSFSEDALTVCPRKGGPATCEAPGEGPVKKVFSAVSISFKGDGFYKNDHGSGAAAREKESTPAKAGSPEGSSGGSSDAGSSPGSSSNGSSSGATSPASTNSAPAESTD